MTEKICSLAKKCRKDNCYHKRSHRPRRDSCDPNCDDVGTQRLSLWCVIPFVVVIVIVIVVVSVMLT